MNTISIVVITRNEEAHIGRCLRSVLAASEEIGGAEVLVVDSDSTDCTLTIVHRLGVRTISLNPKSGVSAAAGRFVGFHHTNGDLVMFVDADTIIDRHWLRTAIPYFHCPDVAGIMGYLYDCDSRGRPLHYVGRHSSSIVTMLRLRGIAMYRREAMNDVGTFNPYLSSEEEAELGFRLRRKGWRLFQIPHEMGRHLRGASPISFLMTALRQHRFVPIGRTARYALKAGGGPQFIFERFFPTLAFVAVTFSLLTVFVFCYFAHRSISGGMMIFVAAASAAVAIKKHSWLGPLVYVVQHSLIFYGLVIGLITTVVKDSDDYPLDAIDSGLPQCLPTHKR